MRKTFKNEIGITLIALVITIIVLLILAGVAIATLTGDNGILTKAVQAKDATRGGEVKDYVSLAVAENAMADNTNGARKTKAQIISELSSQGKLTAEEVAKLTDKENPVDVITIGGIEIDFGELLTLVEMYDKAVADGCINEDGNCANKEHLHIGDYVDYKNPTTGSKRANATDTGYESDQTYEASKNQLNWRVLGKDETTGGIKLISGRPMKSNNSETDPYLRLVGAKGYINSETVLNDLCSLYTTQYGTARSVNRDDINEITGITTDEKIKEFNLGPQMWGATKQYGETYSFENHYTPQSWLNGRQQRTVSGIVNEYEYTVNSGKDLIVEVTNIRAYNMLFENVTKACYWLNSRNSGANSNECAYFGLGVVIEGTYGVWVHSYALFYSNNGRERDYCYGVRPVISLKSGTTEKEVPKVADKTEETWNF